MDGYNAKIASHSTPGEFRNTTAKGDFGSGQKNTEQQPSGFRAMLKTSTVETEWTRGILKAFGAG